MPTLHDIMTSVLSSGEPGPDLGPGPGLPAEAEAELPPGPGARPALWLRAPDCEAEISGHQAHQTRVGLFQKMLENTFLFIHSFTHRNAPQLKLVFLCAGVSVQTGVDSRAPGRQTPASSVLGEPDEPQPLPHLLILHVAVRVTHPGGLQRVSLDSGEVETCSEPGNINSPAVIKRLTVFVLSQDLKKNRGIRD